jgi:hypothetical protein
MVRYQVLVLEPFLIKVPLSVDNNHDGRLEIFGLDDNLGARHAWIIPNNGWSDQKLIEDFV